MKVGIIREGKNPPDKRVAFAPQQLQALSESKVGIFDFKIEKSAPRAFSDEEYLKVGLEVLDDISDCEIFFGVKEVPSDRLVPNSTYFFFSHTIKKQIKNRALLQAILEKNIRLIDYEVLKDDQDKRVVAFGRWAGIVGAYNAFWTYGKKTSLFDLERAFNCESLQNLFSELEGVQLPPIKIIVTGIGRVGKGIMEILSAMKIREVNAHDFIHLYFEEPVFVVLGSRDYYKRKSDGGYDRDEFYKSPEIYESHFSNFSEAGEILIVGAFWNPSAPRLFSLEDISKEDFQLSVIADISCDVNGSVPTTLRSTTIDHPVFDVDRATGEELPAFGKQSSISVMAIDNLPCELPRESSREFGSQLIEWVLPELEKENSALLDRATIARDGDLTLEFMYLRDYLLSHD
jgi:alanine dehydrogenase